jgi:hypothetical protein
LRRYIEVLPSSALQFAIFENMKEAMGCSLSIPQRLGAGAVVGRCRLTLSTPR